MLGAYALCTIYTFLGYFEGAHKFSIEDSQLGCDFY